MSADDEAADMMCCASCGRAEVDDIKLKLCSDGYDGGCDLVKYCSDKCQDNHREQHEEECMKRLAEIRDRDLFAMPESTHEGDCPICCLPLPLPVAVDVKTCAFNTCCSKSICRGCEYANKQREIEAGLEHRCAFCREPLPKSEEESDKRRMKRVKKNDPVAMQQMGQKRREEGDMNLH